MEKNRDSRFIGVLCFDAIATFEEFQKIIMNLLRDGFKLELQLDPARIHIQPPYSGWQIIITKEEA